MLALVCKQPRFFRALFPGFGGRAASIAREKRPGDEVGLQANFTGRVTLSPGSTLQALLTCYFMRAFFVTVQNLK